ncbi:hypothetical protein DFS34DRAFT_626850 [Phlyctochytrium arcticum]|nr:hypothetical protein DFS34DRAFT_626850 [Phlyctochytrium arcticum]
MWQTATTVRLVVTRLFVLSGLTKTKQAANQSARDCNQPYFAPETPYSKIVARKFVAVLRFTLCRSTIHHLHERPFCRHCSCSSSTDLSRA